jgi:hypothetical protein
VTLESFEGRTPQLGDGYSAWRGVKQIRVDLCASYQEGLERRSEARMRPSLGVRRMLAR